MSNFVIPEVLLKCCKTQIYWHTLFPKRKTTFKLVWGIQFRERVLDANDYPIKEVCLWAQQSHNCKCSRHSFPMGTLVWKGSQILSATMCTQMASNVSWLWKKWGNLQWVFWQIVTRSIVEMTFGPTFTDQHSSTNEKTTSKKVV